MDRKFRLGDPVHIIQSERSGVVDRIDTSFGVAVFRVRHDDRPETAEWFAPHELERRAPERIALPWPLIVAGAGCRALAAGAIRTVYRALSGSILRRRRAVQDGDPLPQWREGVAMVHPHWRHDGRRSTTPAMEDQRHRELSDWSAYLGQADSQDEARRENQDSQAVTLRQRRAAGKRSAPARRSALVRAAYRCPPEAVMRSPVSQEDWSEARNSATRAISSGRPIGSTAHMAFAVAAFMIFPAGRRPSQEARAFGDYLERAIPSSNDS
jgi:hypothetical protein